jgi:chitosanase
LDATRVPWIVIPDSFFQEKKVPQNALSAVVCNGKLFYGIMGDTDADTPEVIGEASLLLGNSCFPDEQLNGGTGHEALDVLCKVH